MLSLGVSFLMFKVCQCYVRGLVFFRFGVKFLTFGG